MPPSPWPVQHWDLALVGLEIDDFCRLGISAGQLLFGLVLKLFLGHLAGFVQPGCTIEVLVGPSGSTSPSHRLKFSPDQRWKVFVNRHQVVCLSSRFRKPSLQKIIERRQPLHSPVLARPHFAKVSAQFDKVAIPLCLIFLFPGEDLIYFREDEKRSPAIELRQHGRVLAGSARRSRTCGHFLRGVVLRRHQRYGLRHSNDCVNWSTFCPLPLPKAAAEPYGSIRAALESKGEMIGNNDLWIAAHARAAQLTLVTNDESEFRRIGGLKIQNWVA